MMTSTPENTLLQKAEASLYAKLLHWGTQIGLLVLVLFNLVGIALLAACSIPPLLGLIPLYLTHKDYIYVGICVVIIVVLVLAASGILTGGH